MYVLVTENKNTGIDHFKVEVSKEVTYLFGTYLGTDYKLKN